MQLREYSLFGERWGMYWLPIETNADVVRVCITALSDQQSVEFKNITTLKHNLSIFENDTDVMITIFKVKWGA